MSRQRLPNAMHVYWAQHAAQRGNWIGLVIAHELEPLGGIASVSRANQAAAFDRISRSSLSCLTSRRRRTSSSRSALVKPFACGLHPGRPGRPSRGSTGRRLKLLGQLLRRSTGSNQINYLSSEFWRISSTCSSRHRGHLLRYSGVHQTGATSDQVRVGPGDRGRGFCGRHAPQSQEIMGFGPARRRLCRNARTRRLRIGAQPQSRVHRRRPTGSQSKPSRWLPTAQRGPTAHGAVGRRCLALAVCGVGASRGRQVQQNASSLRAPRLGKANRPSAQVPGVLLMAPYLRLQAHTVRYRERT